jgi:hypothetical protein
VWDYDVASMYPASMTEIQFPYPSPECFTKQYSPPISCLEREGFTKCIVRVPKTHIPPLPYRSGPKLLFPWGTLQGVWTNLELRYALSVGCTIEKLHWSYTAHKTFNPFSGYVGDLYLKRLLYAYPRDCEDLSCKHHAHSIVEAKCSSAFATEEVIKLFLNGLYGKFAQNFLTETEATELGVKAKKGGGIFKPITEASMEEILYTGQEYPDYLYRGYVIDKATPKLKRFMNPILSAYVTARARVKLHEFISLSEKEGAQVLYTDTDSLYTAAPISFATREKILGKLQVGKEWRSILIVGPKSKRLESLKGDFVNTAKGVPGKSFLVEDKTTMRSRKVKPRDDLFGSMEDNQLRTEYSRFMRMKEALRRGLLPNEIVPMVKEFNPFEFPKRRIIGKPQIRDLLYGKYQTEPWEIDSETLCIVGEENA